jgi:ubiquinone/menaquinone biosynthesis C-methylase UbiE
MRPHRYADYMFENPPLLQIAADRMAAPLFAPGRFARLMGIAELAEGERVLDFGCGGGLGARVIAKTIGPDGRLTCVDVSSVWMGLCRKRLRRFANAEFYLGDLEKLPVPDADYDLVLVHRVLRFIQAGNRQRVVDCLAQKLSLHGRLLISEKTEPRIGFEAHRIRKLAENAGLVETRAALKGARFTALFEKPREGF